LATLQSRLNPFFADKYKYQYYKTFFSVIYAENANYYAKICVNYAEKCLARFGSSVSFKLQISSSVDTIYIFGPELKFQGNKLECFVDVRHLHPSLMFVSRKLHEQPWVDP
jgi:hypothetical protein